MPSQSPKPLLARRHPLVVALVVLLALLSLLATARRMTAAPDDGLAGRLLLPERLMLAAKFCQTLGPGTRSFLLCWASAVETDPTRLAVLAGAPISAHALQALSPGYRILALYQSEPTESTRQQLLILGSQSLRRLNICLAILSLLLLVSLACTILADRPKERPAFPARVSLAAVLGLYWAWDGLNYFAVGAVARTLTGLDALGRLSVILLLGYLTMAALLGVAAARTGWRPYLNWSGGWVGAGFVACLVGITLANQGMAWWLGAPVPTSGLVIYLLFHASAQEMLIVVALSCLVAPLFEELIFRGWLLAGLVPHLGPVRSVLLSALFFAMVHGDVGHLPGLFWLGTVLGWVYLRSGSLWAAVAVHAMWNGWVMCNLYANMP